MRIHSPALSYRDEEAVLQVSVESPDLPDTLWFSVPRTYGSYAVTEKADCFVLGLLPPAMLRGEKVEVGFPLSERLLYSLRADLMDMVRMQLPELTKIHVSADEVDTGKLFSSGEGVVAALSGGVDSFTTVIDHVDESVPRSYRLTHLLYSNVGAHGPNPRARASFRELFSFLSPLATEIGMEFIPIDSNLDDFYQDLLFEKTHAFRNVAAALVLQKLFRRFYLSSTYSYDSTFLGPTYNSAHADPLILPRLSTEHTDCIAIGGHYSRLEKVMKVADYEPSYRYLDLCIRSKRDVGQNCSVCWKCGRHLLTLEIIGKIECYKARFDVEKYCSHHATIVATLFSRAFGPDQMFIEREIVRLARDRGYQFSLHCWLKVIPVFVVSVLARFSPDWLRWRLRRVIDRMIRIPDRESVDGQQDQPGKGRLPKGSCS